MSVRDDLTGPITFTSYVTKLARKVGALASASVKFLDEVPPAVGAEHFVHAHLLRISVGAGAPLWSITLYSGYETEVQLPALRLRLYTARRLILDLRTEEPARHSIYELVGCAPRSWHERGSDSVIGPCRLRSI